MICDSAFLRHYTNVFKHQFVDIYTRSLKSIFFSLCLFLLSIHGAQSQSKVIRVGTVRLLDGKWEMEKGEKTKGLQIFFQGDSILLEHNSEKVFVLLGRELKQKNDSGHAQWLCVDKEGELCKLMLLNPRKKRHVSLAFTYPEMRFGFVYQVRRKNNPLVMQLLSRLDG
jgi:hypothetical protein